MDIFQKLIHGFYKDERKTKENPIGPILRKIKKIKKRKNKIKKLSRKRNR